MPVKAQTIAPDRSGVEARTLPDRVKPFSIEINPFSENKRISYVTLNGFLDAHTVSDFERAMEGTISEGCCLFILDMGCLSYTSSAGIGALMRLMQELCRRDGDLVLMNPTKNVLEILELLDFTKIFKMAQSSDEACTLLLESA